MYKLLIVDDEPLVQVGIKSMVDWNSIGVEVCGIASNGKLALDIIEEKQPQIVISDIKMPIMTGLELAKECKERYGEDGPTFIILTSFEEFNLVREAMHYNVSEYLIKLELTPELLKETVEKITKKLDEELKSAPVEATTTTSILNSFNDKFFISLLHNLFESRDQFLLQANELKVNFEHEDYTVGYFEIINGNLEDLNLYHSALQMSHNLFFKYNQCYLVTLDLHHFAVIFTDATDDDLTAAIKNVSDSLKNYYNASLVCGLGVQVTDPLSITESYQCARDAFSTASIDKAIVTYDNSNTKNFKSSFNFSIFKDSLSKAYEEFDQELLNNTLNDITELFKAHPGHHLQAMDCASNILYMSISLVPNGEEVVSNIFSDSPNGYHSLYKLTTTEQIINWLNTFSAALSDYFMEHKKDTRKPIVTNIKRYIKDNIKDHLSLNEVAAAFGISPNYLSQLFKKYNDCGFNEYVTNCKINEARRLLTSGEYKVYEVAEMLGFENAFYFSKVFKKVVGIPPTTFMGKE